jgi:Na+/H+ antiporter NhaD/arsenite permease-like protein
VRRELGRGPVTAMNDVAAIVLIATLAAVIARQLGLRGPPVWAIFLVGAMAMVGSLALSVQGASSAVSSNLPVLVFLFALFVFAAGLEQAGALDHLGRWIVGRTSRPQELPLVLFVTLGLLSAFVLNDALVLVGVPLLFGLARRLSVPAEPLLLTLAFAVSVGSVFTPFGNPQNLLVSLNSGLRTPVVSFLRYLLLPTAINLVLGGLYLRWAFRPKLALGGRTTGAPVRIPLLPSSGWPRRLLRFPTLLVFPATLIGIVGSEVAASLGIGPGLPIYFIALAGAALVLAASPARATLLQRVDWSILVLFASLFVVVAGAIEGGVLAAIQGSVPIPPASHPATSVPAIVLTSVAGSQLVSNVPWVGLQIPLLHGLGYGPNTPWAWTALAGGSTLAGNATLLGAASNLIVMQQAERGGVAISLRTFVRWGLPLTAISVTVLVSCLMLGL